MTCKDYYDLMVLDRVVASVFCDGPVHDWRIVYAIEDLENRIRTKVREEG